MEGGGRVECLEGSWVPVVGTRASCKELNLEARARSSVFVVSHTCKYPFRLAIRLGESRLKRGGGFVGKLCREGAYPKGNRVRCGQPLSNMGQPGRATIFHVSWDNAASYL